MTDAIQIEEIPRASDMGGLVNAEGSSSPVLPETSEVIETIDTSSTSCRTPPQDELLIFNVDFEEMAHAMFGQMDLVEQIISGKIPPNATRDTPPPPKIDLDDIRMSPELELNDDRANDDMDAKPLSEMETQPETMKSCKKKEKSEANRKSKEDKNIEHVLKALSTLKSPEEKLLALCKKYAGLMEEQRAVQHSFKVVERKNQQLVKEKEQLKTDHSKAILTRSRLESLCRELQRQNKIVKDESLIRVREEEEKRKEVSAKFQTTFNEVTSLMQDSNQKSSKLREENIDLAQKLKTLIEQYELREQHVDKVIHQKELETQLADAKLAKATMLMKDEREQLLQDKHRCLQELAEYQKKCHELTTNEVQLRTQLNLYTDKYEEFQTTLNKSNEMFTHFKKEMDQMSKKIKKLEKETGNWKNRWESSNKALIEMAAEKQQRDMELINSAKKILQLEKLCRALQTERQAHLTQIKLLKSSNSSTLDDTFAQITLDEQSSSLPETVDSPAEMSQTVTASDPAPECTTTAEDTSPETPAVPADTNLCSNTEQEVKIEDSVETAKETVIVEETEKATEEKQVPTQQKPKEAVKAKKKNKPNQK